MLQSISLGLYRFFAGYLNHILVMCKMCKAVVRLGVEYAKSESCLLKLAEVKGNCGR